MTSLTTEPIEQHWTTEEFDESREGRATAADVNHRLALIEVADIEPRLVPYLAAAAAELALMADISWRFGTDDAPVALLRLIAKVTMRHPEAGGPHTTRLFDELR